MKSWVRLPTRPLLLRYWIVDFYCPWPVYLMVVGKFSRKEIGRERDFLFGQIRNVTMQRVSRRHLNWLSTLLESSCDNVATNNVLRATEIHTYYS